MQKQQQLGYPLCNVIFFNLYQSSVKGRKSLRLFKQIEKSTNAIRK